MIKEIKDNAKAEAENEAKEVLVQAIQRCAADTTVESTLVYSSYCLSWQAFFYSYSSSFSISTISFLSTTSLSFS